MWIHLKSLLTEARADLGTYPDAGKVHDYAYDAFSWANAEGLITGTTGAFVQTRLSLA